MEGFDSKVAVITGGGRGLGRVIALALAERGTRIAVNDIFSDESGGWAAEEVVGEIESVGGEAFADHEDVSSWSGAERLMQAAVDRYGSIDILVLCAGTNAAVGLMDVSEAQWDATIAVHLKGHSGCMRAAAQRMIEQGNGGRMITLASRGAFFSKSAPYAAAKAGIMGLSIEAARELAPHGITVNCLLPSATTQLFPGKDPGDRLMGGMPESVDLSPEAIAPVVTYLASADSANVTGRFVYASGEDICFYQTPLLLTGFPTFLRKVGGWTAEELSQALPSVIGAP